MSLASPPEALGWQVLPLRPGSLELQALLTCGEGKGGVQEREVAGTSAPSRVVGSMGTAAAGEGWRAEVMGASVAGGRRPCCRCCPVTCGSKCCCVL